MATYIYIYILMAAYSRTRHCLAYKTEQTVCSHSVGHMQVTQLHFCHAVLKEF